MKMDRETRTRARAAVRGILESAAFEVEDFDGAVDLYATRGDECLVLLCSDNPEEILEFDRRTYRLKGEGCDLVCRKLLFTLRDDVQVKSCVRWGAEELAHHAGRAVVAEVKGERLELNLELQASPAKPDVTSATAGGPPVRHIPKKIDAARAIAAAGIEGEPVLRYIPYWEFHAVCAGAREYRGKRIEFGCERRGFINAINGRLEDLDASNATASPIEGNAELVPPKIPKEESSERVKAAIIDEQTKKLRFREEKGEAIFYEEKVFKPDPEDVKVEMDILHIPVWVIRGKKIVEVNGLTGEILSEPMDEGVEVY